MEYAFVYSMERRQAEQNCLFNRASLADVIKCLRHQEIREMINRSNSTIEFHLPVDSQYSSPVETLHLIVESKSQPVEVNNSTIELHLPVEAKEKLPIILFYQLLHIHTNP